MINGGYMVMNPEVFDYIEGDQTVLKRTIRKSGKRWTVDGVLS